MQMKQLTNTLKANMTNKNMNKNILVEMFLYAIYATSLLVVNHLSGFEKTIIIALTIIITKLSINKHE